MSMREARSRVCHIITGLGTGGAERALYNLLAGGLANTFSTHVISLSDEGTYGNELKRLGVEVRCFNMRSLSGVASLRMLLSHVGGIRPSVVQGWMYHGNLVAYLARKLTCRSSQLFWNVRQSLYDISLERPGTRQVIRANRRFSRKPEAIIYNSDVSRQLHEHFGFSANNGVVIPNGVDTAIFAPSSSIAGSLRGKLGIATDAVVFGHVARFHPLKDHLGFLRAAVAVAGDVAQAVFLLVGTDVTYKNAAIASAIPPSLRHRFHLLGETSDVPAVMRSLNVLVLNSISEAFPNVLVEAMASGVCCITTEVGDAAMIVGETGIVVPPSDHRKLAAAMLDLAAAPDRVRLLSASALTRVEGHFHIDAAVQRYAALYNGVGAGG